MDTTGDGITLMDLPDPCLLAVLRCCADDMCSLFSAARAHSRLQQAAVLVANSIRAAVPEQQQTDSALRYLSGDGELVHSISLQGCLRTMRLHELPHNHLTNLFCLHLSDLPLQLQPGNWLMGVLSSSLPIPELQLQRFSLLDWQECLAAALALLPKLQHLSLVGIASRTGSPVSFPSSTLQLLQQLTYLETTGQWLPDELQPLHGLQGLTHLQDLRLHGLDNAHNIQKSMMSGLQMLTQFRVVGSAYDMCGFEPDVLAGKTRLQHLEVVNCCAAGGIAGVAQLLAHVAPMQLTYLCLRSSLHSPTRGGPLPPATAYSPLTGSSRLQYLDISHCEVPEGVWAHVFHASMQLPHLQQLDISHLRHPYEDGYTDSECHVAMPEGSRLVSCCPGLQSLHLSGLSYSNALLEPLTGLSGLWELDLCAAAKRREGLDAVAQLTGLRELRLYDLMVRTSADAAYAVEATHEARLLLGFTIIRPGGLQTPCQCAYDVHT